MTKTRDADRRIEMMPLADVKPALRNPKTHDAEAIGASVERFGYVEPMVLDERTGRLVAGHGRLEHLLALQKKGGKRWSCTPT